MFYVGIDWADQKHDVTVVDQEGEFVLKPMTIEKSYRGFEKLSTTLRTLCGDPQEFRVGIETEHNLLVDYLLDLDYPVFVLFAGLMPELRKRYRISGAHDDGFDAFVLADAIRTDKRCWRRVNFGSELTRQIRILARDHHTLIDKQVVLKNSFRATLNLYYPEYIHCFGKVSCKTSVAFIQAYPDFTSARQLSLEQLKEFFKEHHYNSKQAVQRIYTILHQEHLPVPKPLLDTKRFKAVMLAKRSQQMVQDVDQYDKRLEKLVKQHPDAEIFLSYPGVSHINAARLISFFGDVRERFRDVSEVQALAGTCPVTDKSGKSHHAIYFRRACNKYYRHLIHQVAFTSLTQCQWAKKFYKKHRKHSKNHSHALRCLSNVHLKILFAMWKKQTCYDEKVFLAQRESNKLSMVNE